MMAPCNLKYMFSIKAGFPARYVAKTPAGYRIDVEYRAQGSQPEITTDCLALALAWRDEIQASLNPSVVSAFYEKYCDVDRLAQQLPEGERKTIAKYSSLGPLVIRLAALALGSEYSKVVEELERKALGRHEQVPALSSLLELWVTPGSTAPQEPGSELKAFSELFVEALRDFFEDSDEPNRPWLGIEGRIVSGVDWALLRADGVMEFDGQLVLTDGPLDDKKGKGVLVNARTSGSVDLCPKQDRPYSLDNAVDMLRDSGYGTGVGIALAIRFEAPQESEPWASKKYTRRKGQLKYIRLSRGQFIGHGRLEAFGSKNGGAHIALNVYQVEVS
jgi:hypothetical protein